MLSLIVAMSENRVIGRNGRLPWHLSSDLRRFKQLTLGHHLVMGRRTFEAIGRLLPGRISVVITRQAGYQAAGALAAGNLDAALGLTAGDGEVFVVGGAEIYRLALPAADRIFLTLVHAQLEGDAFFPAWDEAAWHLVESTRHPRDDRNEYAYSFLTYLRGTHA
jgi:dihydrofolate reductase